MRIRKADREILAAVDSAFEDGHIFTDSGKQAKAWSSFYQRVLDEELKKAKKETGYPVRDAVTLLQGVLGRRLVVPRSPSRSWYIQLQNRINASGLDAAQLTEAANTAAKRWQGPIKFESVVRQADTLLSGADGGSTPSRPSERETMEEL